VGAARHTNTLKFRAGLTLKALLCSSCGHRWLPTSAEGQRLLETAYSNGYTGFRVDPFFNRVVQAEIEHRLKKAKTPPASLLDVGCGNGAFLGLAAAAGYQARGIDVSPVSIELCRRNGLVCVAGDFLLYGFGQSFDLITMWDVMEHLREPRAFVARAGELLSPSGVLVLKIPSKGALNFHVLRVAPRRGGTLLGAPNHVQFFNERSLAATLRACGFVDALWFEHLRFRKRPRTADLRKIAARAVGRVLSTLANDENLYVMASKTTFEPQALANIPHRRREKLLV
jgi:SAM-dependent methyltransferase